MNKTYKLTNKSYKLPKENKDYSFENETPNHKPSKAGLAAATLASLLTAACNAPGYVMSTEADRKRVDSITEQEFGGVDETVKSFMNGVSLQNGKLTITNVGSPYIKSSDELQNFLDEDNDNITSRDYSTFEKLEKQNDLLNKLYDQSKFKKKIIHDVQRNLDFEAFEVPTGMQNSDLDELAKTMLVLQDSLYSLTNTDISALQQKVAEKSKSTNKAKFAEEFNDLVASNNQLKADLKRLSLISANINHGEHLSNEIDAAVDLYTALHFSQTGEDMYKKGAELFNSLKSKKIGEVANGDAHVFKGGFKQDQTVESVVSELFKKISEESGDNGRHSRHTIAQEHYMQLKNIISEAHENRILISKDEESGIKSIADYNQLNNERAIALEKYFSNESAKHMLNGINKDQGINGWTVALSLVPFAGIYKMIASAPYAFAPDKTEIKGAPEDGLKMAIYQGGRWKYGIENHNNVVGSKSADVADFWAGLGGTVITAAGMGYGGYMLISNLVGGGAGTQTSGAGSGPAFGGENGGPGTGN